MADRCKERSRAAGQPVPCRESRVSPGTCVWCFRRIEPGQVVDPPGPPWTLSTRLPEDESPIHPSDLRGMRFKP